MSELTPEQRAKNRKSTIMSITDTDRMLRAQKERKFFCPHCLDIVPQLFKLKSNLGNEKHLCLECIHKEIDPEFDPDA